MAIRINLLPQKERARSALPVFLASLLLPLLAGGSWAYIQWSGLQTEIETLQKEALQTKVAAEQRRQESGTASALDTQLQQAVQEAAASKVNVLPILDTLVGFLPERGVFETFSYQENALILEIRLDEKRDSAYFYSRLAEQSWAKDVKLSFLKAIDIQDEAGNARGVPRYVVHYEITVEPAKAKEPEKEAGT